MNQKVISLCVCVFYLFSLGSSAIAETNQSGSDDETSRLYVQSNVTKMYQVLRLIDDHRNWFKVSELLREILASDIDNKFIRQQLSLAKDEIDAYAYKQWLTKRIEDVPFLVAKLRVVEAMMATRLRLNISYDREVALIKGLLQTYFFPGFENDGKIIFPDKNTYSFDLYGYVKKNILKTETAPSGVIDDPRFPKTDDEEKTKKDHNVSKAKFTPKVLETEQQSGSLEAHPQGLVDDIQAIHETMTAVKDIWTGTQNDLEDLSHAALLQNQYEPWAMMVQIIANPDAIYSDPQLYQFLKGVKLQVKISEPYGFDPLQQEILKTVLTDEHHVGLDIEQQFDSTTGQVVMFAVSNLVDPELISFRYLIFLKKILDFSTHAKTVKVGEKVGVGVIQVAQFLMTLKGADVWYTKLAVALGRVSGRTIIGGQKVITYVMEKDGEVRKLLEVFRNLRIGKGKLKVRMAGPVEWIAQNDRYFKAVLYVSMAHDLAAGFIQFISARDKFEKIEIMQETAAKEISSLLYLAPLVSQRLIWTGLSWGAFAFDMGSLFSDDIPPTHRVIKGIFAEWLPFQVKSLWNGTTFRGEMIETYESRLEIVPDEVSWTLQLWLKAITEAQNPGQLVVAKEAFERDMRAYANKRLFMIYYLIQRWNNREISELGLMERRYWNEYEAYAQELTAAKLQYDQKLQSLVVKSLVSESGE